MRAVQHRHRGLRLPARPPALGDCRGSSKVIWHTSSSLRPDSSVRPRVCWSSSGMSLPLMALLTAFHPAAKTRDVKKADFYGEPSDQLPIGGLEKRRKSSCAGTGRQLIHQRHLADAGADVVHGVQRRIWICAGSTPPSAQPKAVGFPRLPWPLWKGRRSRCSAWYPSAPGGGPAR